MSIFDPMFMYHLMQHHKESFDLPLMVQKNIEEYSNMTNDFNAFIEMSKKMITPKPEAEEVKQVYTAMKRNNIMVIVNKDGEVVYPLPHFLKHHLKSREQLQKLADIFTEKNQTDIDAIREFETSLR